MNIAVELIWMVFILSDWFDAPTITLISGSLLTCLYTFTTFMMGIVLPLVKSSGAEVSFGHAPSLTFLNYLFAAVNVLIALLFGWYFLALMVALSFFNRVLLDFKKS